MTKILVCNPEYYAINYEINPWMNLQNQVNRDLAVQQWQNLVELLKHVGATVEEMTGQPNLPDMVFTANAGLVFDNKKFVLSNFKYPERQPEREYYKHWFENNGYEFIDPFPLEFHWEGAGDALFLDQSNKVDSHNILFFGYNFRSDRDAVMTPNWMKLWPGSINVLKLLDPYFYHLDTCFCPIKDDFALIWPGAFEKVTLNYLDSKLKLLRVPEEDARKFACNAVAVDNKIIIPAGCEATKKLLQDAGFEVFDTNMSEFIKAGGACKCLTLRLE